MESLLQNFVISFLLSHMFRWMNTLGVLIFASQKKLYFTGINFRELKKFDFLRVLIFANWSYFKFSRELIWRLPTFNKM